MPDLYPPIEPYEHGMLEVEGGDRIYWETCGNPCAKPALVVHGGPGSGCTPWHRRLFNPDAYRIVLLDQRGCGRSRPHASAPEADLAGNTTRNLLADLEALRAHLRIDRWLLLGGSWGSALALAYAEQFPARVSEIVLWGVTTGRRCEFDWTFRGGLGALFPQQWERLRAAAPGAVSDADVADAYSRMLYDRVPAVCERAALEWCTWESATPDWPPTNALAPRFNDPAYRLAFARIVTHFVRHDAWLEDGILLRNADALSEIPGAIVSGRFDLQAPLEWAWELRRRWPRARHVIVENAGHSAANAAIAHELVRATDRFANL